MSVPSKNIDRFLKIFSDEDVEATVIGEFTGTKRLELFYHKKKVCDLDMEFLHEGIQRITKKAKWSRPRLKRPKKKCAQNLNDSLYGVLSHYNVCSKEWIIRQYDHEVQGGSVIKPLVGINCDGPSDAAVVMPKMGEKKGVAISNGINVRYGRIDPYWMAASCIDEAVRQIVAVGGNPDRIALLDNFCWGNPDKPDRLGGLVRAAQACYKFALDYGAPFISGKDSLYNEYAENNRSIAIPGTLLISAIGLVEDVNKCISMDFKKAGNLIYVVGQTHDELGGSIYFDNLNSLGVNVPKVNTKQGVKIFSALYDAVKKGLITSMHDCSEGGLGVALAEMAFSGSLGLTARLDKVPYKGKEKRNDFVLFSESNSRFVVEVSKEKQQKFEKLLCGVPFSCIGSVEAGSEFVVYGLDKQVCVNTYIEILKEKWQSPLRW